MKKSYILTTIIALALSFGAFAGGLHAKERIQLAILLDTSSSMDGLINQAKSQLWNIVNELSRAKRNGEATQLEVAIYEYGNNSLSSGEGYIRMITPLTVDLDKISEELFKLSTNGGSEYCGQVIDNASRDLAWSGRAGDLKLIFIAGNEPFTQGNIDFRSAVRGALQKGIIVNTIHCGGHEEGIQGMWMEGAAIGQGKYLNIDHNQRIDPIHAPQDEEILSLGRELNQTYIGYGSAGEANRARQEKQDLNAASISPEVAVQRSATKASGSYENSGWDLVDAVTNSRVRADSLPEKDLPAEMRKMSPAQRKDYVLSMQKKRETIQGRISKLHGDRLRFVEQENRKRAKNTSLDSAITGTIREQAGSRGYEITN